MFDLITLILPSTRQDFPAIGSVDWRVGIVFVAVESAWTAIAIAIPAASQAEEERFSQAQQPDTALPGFQVADITRW
jgi:hypothetical protein